MCRFDGFLIQGDSFRVAALAILSYDNLRFIGLL